MRTLLKGLAVAVAMLSLPACTAYMYEGHDYHQRRQHAGECTHRVGIIGIAIARAGESQSTASRPAA